MRRFALFACALAVLGAAGCTQPAKAGDGDLVDDWAMMAEAKVPEPAAGSCWGASGYTATPCDETHVYETAAVGHFTGTVAGATSPPAVADRAEAWAECDKAAGAYLGGEWQGGWVEVVLRPPTSRQWTGGARFYRCDVGTVASEKGDPAPGKVSVKGSLAGASALRIGCGTQVRGSDDTWTDVVPVACTEAHDTEYVGAVNSATADRPSDRPTHEAAFSKACEAKVLAYTGMSRNGFARAPDAFYGWWITSTDTEWKAGNHTARCYLLIKKRKINRSLKGVGDVSI